ncbi:MAG TPA: hypothetical protein VIS72_14120 [Anaerolineales bacterium]
MPGYLPINSSVKGREKKWMKKVPNQVKGTETFLFGTALKQEFNQQTAFQIPAIVRSANNELMTNDT